MSVNWAKAIYITFLLVLVVLLVLAFYHPITTESKYSEVQWVQMLETNGERIAEFNIINHELKDMNYTIVVTVDEKNYTENVLIRKGGMFTYIYHIYMEKLIEDEVTFKVYKEGWSAPIDELTYYLKKGTQ